MRKIACLLLVGILLLGLAGVALGASWPKSDALDLEVEVAEYAVIKFDDNKNTIKITIAGEDEETGPRSGADFRIRSNAQLRVDINAGQLDSDLQYRLWVQRQTGEKSWVQERMLDYGQESTSFDTQSMGEHFYRVQAMVKRVNDWWEVSSGDYSTTVTFTIADAIN